MKPNKLSPRGRSRIGPNPSIQSDHGELRRHGARSDDEADLPPAVAPLSPIQEGELFMATAHLSRGPTEFSIVRGNENTSAEYSVMKQSLLQLIQPFKIERSPERLARVGELVVLEKLA